MNKLFRQFNFLRFATLITLLIALLFCSTITIAQSSTAPPCSGPYKGKKLSRNEIVNLISLAKPNTRAETLNFCDADLSGLHLSNLDLSYANLTNADLTNVTMNNTTLDNATINNAYFRWGKLSNASFQSVKASDANFSDATLTDTKFQQADLTYANFMNAQLTNSNFRGSTLTSANFTNANLNNATFNFATLHLVTLNDATAENAYFERADLSSANLSQTNLTNADLRNANLSRAKLIKTLIKQTDFANANFKETLFEPIHTEMPNLISLSTAKNFESITYETDTSSRATLTALRNAYKEIGMRSMERVITATIKKRDMVLAWHSGSWGKVESFISYILFYMTSNFGSNPGRPIRIFLLLVLVYAIPYRIALSRARVHSGIFVIWTNKFYQPSSQQMHERELKHLLKMRPQHTLKQMIHEQLRLIRIALFFSLVSAFSIGWRQINVSNWILKLQTREYCMRGRGWVRTLAGSQSLISAYLIVMWLLTYFGRPFEW